MMQIDDVVITCCKDDCGISFAVPQWWHRGKRETHAFFYYPNGHQQRFLVESDTEKMRRERDNAREQLERAEEEKAEAWCIADKAQHEATRLKKRITRQRTGGK